ncbi:hypothetical protein ILUMI_11871 [Ignelater luminosus]|uniref:Amine oxidase domain-containing protein n=1 Tax=Ignelater luminosus TaxID=2038154 RepID=A0A8K0CZQ2_IGNLU|nr:hypothetical protein ILUMI_11871 [Ignelater luminosus]
MIKDLDLLSVYEDKQDSNKSLGDYMTKRAIIGCIKRQLPEEKVNVIETLGADTVLKLFFRFPNRWWPVGSPDFVFIWSEEDRRRLTENVLKDLLRMESLEIVGIPIFISEEHILIKQLYQSSSENLQKLFYKPLTASNAPSVVIAGAGPAGIAAASKLLQNNVTDITILEAENRIGGRVYSVKFGDAFIDLGAQWCHGEENNIVLEKSALSVEGAFSWFDVAAAQDYKECEGNSVLDWKGRGYKTILDVLMQKYPNPENQLPIDDKIFLNKEVATVEWNNTDKAYSEKAVVKCKDGSTYYADHVIFTPSLGVLKHNYKTLFRPSLPVEKVNAIETLGIDAVLKVFLHFPNRWWPGVSSPGLMFIWSEEDKSRLVEEFPKGPIKNGSSWLSNLLGVFAVNEENPNLLVAWFLGEMVPDIEKCSDNVLSDGIMFAVNKFLKNKFPNITPPDAIIYNNWYSNPHFRGVYSYQTIASRQFGESPEVILSKPLTASNGKQTLLFAGEATHPIYYSAVHGAIETGHREAQRIIDIYSDYL